MSPELIWQYVSFSVYRSLMFRYMSEELHLNYFASLIPSNSQIDAALGNIGFFT